MEDDVGILNCVLVRRKVGKGRGLGRVETDSGRVLVLGLRLQEKLLKVLAFIKHLFYLFFSNDFEAVRYVIYSMILIMYLISLGTYIDKKCPFTGDVSIRGRILSGTCHSAKMVKTIIVRRDYFHYVKKYQRQEDTIPSVVILSNTLKYITNSKSILFVCCFV